MRYCDGWPPKKLHVATGRSCWPSRGHAAYVPAHSFPPSHSFYYDCLMKPNAKSVTTALRKVKDLPYTLIANGHGPMLRCGEVPPGAPG